MFMPTISGLIRRRILVNYRVDPDVIQGCLPAPFRPKLVDGAALAGICLIRLEQLRPRGMPAPIGWSAENAAHRVAVRWQDERGNEREGVYIPRRDTGSRLIEWAGGRLFPGEHQAARFDVRDEDGVVALAMRSHDGQVAVDVRGRPGRALPSGSVFGSLGEASDFFATGATGYSARRDGRRLDALRLGTDRWHMEVLEVDEVASSYFSDERRFSRGSVAFDCALIMRDIPHQWHAEGTLETACPTDNVEAVAVAERSAPGIR